MNWIEGIQNAIGYIEVHITEELDCEKVARAAYSSVYHFQRVFGIMCGVTVGEYIRRRRLTLAGNELIATKARVTDIALKYGYDTPESFSRAFMRFHGVKPTQARKGCPVKSYSKLTVGVGLGGDDKTKFGGNEMKYRIEEMKERVLVGYKWRFTGVPYGEERAKQEEEFFTTTRGKQWLLIGASCDYTTDYCVVKNIGDDGYDFYIAYELDEWTRQALFCPQITGVDFMEKMGFETLVLPKTLCAVFETERKKRPVSDYVDIRKKIVTEWLPSSPYQLADAPEIVIMHWRPKGEWERERYVEICLPVEQRIAEK